MSKVNTGLGPLLKGLKAGEITVDGDHSNTSSAESNNAHAHTRPSPKQKKHHHHHQQQQQQQQQQNYSSAIPNMSVPPPMLNPMTPNYMNQGPMNYMGNDSMNYPPMGGPGQSGPPPSMGASFPSFTSPPPYYQNPVSQANNYPLEVPPFSTSGGGYAYSQPLEPSMHGPPSFVPTSNPDSSPVENPPPPGEEDVLPPGVEEINVYPQATISKGPVLKSKEIEPFALAEKPAINIPIPEIKDNLQYLEDSQDKLDDKDQTNEYGSSVKETGNVIDKSDNMDNDSDQIQQGMDLLADAENNGNNHEEEDKAKDETTTPTVDKTEPTASPSKTLSTVPIVTRKRLSASASSKSYSRSRSRSRSKSPKGSRYKYSSRSRSRSRSRPRRRSRSSSRSRSRSPSRRRYRSRSRDRYRHYDHYRPMYRNNQYNHHGRDYHYMRNNQRYYNYRGRYQQHHMRSHSYQYPSGRVYYPKNRDRSRRRSYSRSPRRSRRSYSRSPNRRRSYSRSPYRRSGSRSPARKSRASSSISPPPPRKYSRDTSRSPVRSKGSKKNMAHSSSYSSSSPSGSEKAKSPITKAASPPKFKPFKMIQQSPTPPAPIRFYDQLPIKEVESISPLQKEPIEPFGDISPSRKAYDSELSETPSPYMSTKKSDKIANDKKVESKVEKISSVQFKKKKKVKKMSKKKNKGGISKSKIKTKAKSHSSSSSSSYSDSSSSSKSEATPSSPDEKKKLMEQLSMLEAQREEVLRKTALETMATKAPPPPQQLPLGVTIENKNDKLDDFESMIINQYQNYLKEKVLNTGEKKMEEPTAGLDKKEPSKFMKFLQRAYLPSAGQGFDVPKFNVENEFSKDAMRKDILTHNLSELPSDLPVKKAEKPLLLGIAKVPVSDKAETEFEKSKLQSHSKSAADKDNKAADNKKTFSSSDDSSDSDDSDTDSSFKSPDSDISVEGLMKKLKGKKMKKKLEKNIKPPTPTEEKSLETLMEQYYSKKKLSLETTRAQNETSPHTVSNITSQKIEPSTETKNIKKKDTDDLLSIQRSDSSSASVMSNLDSDLGLLLKGIIAKEAPPVQSLPIPTTLPKKSPQQAPQVGQNVLLSPPPSPYMDKDIYRMSHKATLKFWEDIRIGTHSCKIVDPLKAQKFSLVSRNSGKGSMIQVYHIFPEDSDPSKVPLNKPIPVAPASAFVSATVPAPASTPTSTLIPATSAPPVPTTTSIPPAPLPLPPAPIPPATTEPASTIADIPADVAITKKTTPIKATPKKEKETKKKAKAGGKQKAKKKSKKVQSSSESGDDEDNNSSSSSSSSESEEERSESESGSDSDSDDTPGNLQKAMKKTGLDKEALALMMTQFFSTLTKASKKRKRSSTLDGRTKKKKSKK